MMLGLTVSPALILLGVLSINSLSNPDLILQVNSLAYEHNEASSISQWPDRPLNSQPPIENTHVEIVKSFKNSTGFYKINGTIENQKSIILFGLFSTPVAAYYVWHGVVVDRTTRSALPHHGGGLHVHLARRIP